MTDDVTPKVLWVLAPLKSPHKHTKATIIFKGLEILKNL